MKKFALLFITGILITVMAAGQSAVKENRDAKGFSEISYSISGNLNIKIGQEFSVVLEGDKDDLKEVITEVDDGRLRIRQDNWRFNFKNKVNAYVTLPELTALSVSGSGKAQIQDPLRDADDLKLNISGSGSIHTSEVTVDDLECRISGSGNIIFGSAGSADDAKIAISGSGSYSGESFEIDHLDINVSGSGSCLCKVGDSLKAVISGSGNVTYIGNPRIDARVSGSGRVRSR